MPDKCFHPTAPYKYPSGWNFAGVWSWNSKAMISGDFNGDRFQDYARLGPQYIHFFISQGNGKWWTPLYRFPNGWDFTTNENIFTTLPQGDFDGDGVTDFIRSAATYHHGFYPRGRDRDDCWKPANPSWIPQDCISLSVFHYTDGASFTGVWGWPRYSVVVGDFNNDGRDDYLNLGGGTFNHQFIAKD